MPINRRQFVSAVGTAGIANLIGASSRANAAVRARADQAMQGTQGTRGMPVPKIKDISVIEVQIGTRLSVVKITTDQPGLYGYGCATFTQRADLIKPAVELYLKPLLMGWNTDRIEDIWQTCSNSSYWRIGPVLNNAISGVDQALWDIKGRQVGLPVYQLVGGKVREAAEVYRHAGGATPEALVDSIRSLTATGTRNVHIAIGAGNAAPGAASVAPTPAADPLHYGIKSLGTTGTSYDPNAHTKQILQAFEYVRKQLGGDIGLGFDAHERLASPRDAVQFCKDVEQYRPYMIEDPLAPEDEQYFREIRANCATPISMGELFSNPDDWQFLLENRLIDYIRCHVSQVGGFSPARKIAILAEMYQTRTCWHNPGDISPVGIMANLTLDVTSNSFGLQEFGGNVNSQLAEVFQGSAQYKDGYAWVSDLPGWGIEIDEKAAAKYKFDASQPLNGGWGVVRLPDGSIIHQ
jgi:mannonate dehydratase